MSLFERDQREERIVRLQHEADVHMADALTLARKAGKAMTKAEDALSALADMDAPGAGELGGRAARVHRDLFDATYEIDLLEAML